jgi:hypothetical protein
MDHSQLLDYALGRLDGPRCEELEGRLATDSDLSRRFARLKSRLVHLLDDGQAEGSSPSLEPPDSPRPRNTPARCIENQLLPETN